MIAIEPPTGGAEALQVWAEGLDDAELQRLLTVVVRAYARRSLDRPQPSLPPFEPGVEVTATEALVAAGEILRAAEISSFELATILNL